MTLHDISRKPVSWRGRIRAGAGLAAGVVLALAVPAGAAPAPATAPAGVVSPSPLPAPHFNGPVWAVAYADTTVFIGGEFSHAVVAGKRFPRAGLAAIDAGSGELLDWAPGTNGLVTAIAAYQGDVFVAGRFDHVAGVKRDSLARLDGTTGQLRDGWKHPIFGKPFALGVGHDRLYLGGAITQVGADPRAGLAAFDLATGELDERWAPAADGRVNDLAVTADRVYLSGKFHRVDDVRGSRRVAAVDPVTGELDQDFRPADAAEQAHGMAVTADRVYVTHGGVGGRVRAYDHTGRTEWAVTMDGDPEAVTFLDGVVYVGGHFDQVCASARVGDHGGCLDGSRTRVKLAAVRSGDGTLLPWQANANGIVGVRDLAASRQLSGVAAGGEFTTINGTVHRRFAHFRAPDEE